MARGLFFMFLALKIIAWFIILVYVMINSIVGIEPFDRVYLLIIAMIILFLFEFLFLYDKK